MALTRIGKLPEAVGVPESVAVPASKPIPAGRAPDSLQVIVPIPPVWLNGTGG